MSNPSFHSLSTDHEKRGNLIFAWPNRQAAVRSSRCTVIPWQIHPQRFRIDRSHNNSCILSRCRERNSSTTDSPPRPSWACPKAFITRYSRSTAWAPRISFPELHAALPRTTLQSNVCAGRSQCHQIITGHSYRHLIDPPPAGQTQSVFRV